MEVKMRFVCSKDSFYLKENKSDEEKKGDIKNTYSRCQFIRKKSKNKSECATCTC